MSDARIRVVVAPGRRVRINPQMDMAHLFGAPRRKVAASLERRADRSRPSRAQSSDKRDDETEAEYEERRREQRPGETVSEYRERKKRDEQTDPDEADASAFAARMRERARCAAILGSKAAGSRLDMAAHFAFATDMSRREADAALRQIAAGTPPPRQVSRQESFCARMDRQRSPQLGNGFAAEAPDASTPDGLARQMLAVAGVAVDRRRQHQ